MIAPVGILLVVMALAAVLAGVAGYRAALSRRAFPPRWVSEEIAPAKWPYFVADLWAHRTSYASGSLGGITLASYVAGMRFLKRAA